MTISPRGAIVGAIIGGARRGAVILFNLGFGVPVVFVLPSAAIGVLVGGIAGALGRPLRGALVGAGGPARP